MTAFQKINDMQQLNLVMLRVIVTKSGTQMRVRDSSATRIFF